MKFGKIVIAICISVLAPFAVAEKIAVLDLQAAMFETEYAKKRIAAMESSPEYTQVTAQFEALQSDLAALAKEAKTKGMTWNNEQVAAHRKKEEYIIADRQLAYKKIQAEQKAVGEAIQRELMPKIEAAINQVSESEGIDVVLSKQAVYFAKSAVDITGKVVNALNKAQ